MIPADAPIDDELPLFSINLNGKKDREDTNTRMIRISTKKRTIGVVHLPRKTQRPCWDPKITGSGHLAAKPFIVRRLGR